MARAKKTTATKPTSAGIAMRAAAAELERQAAILRKKADQLDGAAHVAPTVVKAKPKKASKRKAAKAKKRAKPTAKKRAAKKGAGRQTDLERDFLPASARGRKGKRMPKGALGRLKAAHKNGALHPAL